LLVEGRDDEHVVYALRDAHGIPKVFDVTVKEGYTQLLNSIPVELKASGRERLAVILDADEDLQKRWNQLSYFLLQAGCPGVPRHPQPEGTILSVSASLRFGVWLMPDNRLPGMLEDFVTFLVPEGDALLPRVDGFLDGIPEDVRPFPVAHRCKARIHSWLAVQEEPGRPLGQAITYHYLDAQQGVVDPFVQWIRRALVD
jgi:hypothetical protein